MALGEAHRVLKIGGHFLCLEFSSVDVPGLDRLYELYSFKVIPAIGRAVTGDAEAYRYLVESIRKFPKPPKFADMIRTAGFRRVVVRAPHRRRGGAAFRLAVVIEHACDRAGLRCISCHARSAIVAAHLLRVSRARGAVVFAREGVLALPIRCRCRRRRSSRSGSRA